MDGPVNNVPRVDASPAAAANLPHESAPQFLNSRAKTCHKSPMPFVKDWSSTTALRRANFGPRINKRRNANGWKAGGRVSLFEQAAAGRVSGAPEIRKRTPHPSKAEAPYAKRTSRAASRPPTKDATA